jgi:CheY-like chemotaxis protein
MLEKLGYAGDLVTDGLAAVEAVQAHTFGAILMDVQMPNMASPPPRRYGGARPRTATGGTCRSSP